MKEKRRRKRRRRKRTRGRSLSSSELKGALQHLGNHWATSCRDVLRLMFVCSRCWMNPLKWRQTSESVWDKIQVCVQNVETGMNVWLPVHTVLSCDQSVYWSVRTRSQFDQTGQTRPQVESHGSYIWLQRSLSISSYGSIPLIHNSFWSQTSADPSSLRWEEETPC